MLRNYCSYSAQLGIICILCNVICYTFSLIDMLNVYFLCWKVCYPKLYSIYAILLFKKTFKICIHFSLNYFRKFMYIWLRIWYSICKPKFQIRKVVIFYADFSVLFYFDLKKKNISKIHFSYTFIHFSLINFSLE